MGSRRNYNKNKKQKSNAVAARIEKSEQDVGNIKITRTSYIKITYKTLNHYL